MQEPLVISMTQADLSTFIDNSITKSVNKIVNAIENAKLHQGSFSIVYVSELFKKEGCKKFGYEFIKNRIKDGSLKSDEFGRITAESVFNYLKIIKKTIE